MFDGEVRFLNKSEDENVYSLGESVVYTSYPRMGQTFLRTYFEKITGVATGCEMWLEMTQDQQMFPFMGEEVTDASVWIKKSHWPMKIPGNVITIGNKFLICTRNPYDTIRSFFHFNTHFVQSSEFAEPISNFPDEWKAYAD